MKIIMANTSEEISIGKLNFRINKRLLFDVPAYLLVGAMLFIPIVFKPLKAALLALVLIIAFAKLARNSRKIIHPAVGLWTVICVITGLIAILYGIVKGNPGPLKVASVYVAWPFVFIIIFTSFTLRRNFDVLFRILVIMAVLISLYCFSFVLSSAGFIPGFLYFDLGMDPGLTISGGFVEFRMYSLSSLIYLVPFLIATLITWPKGVKLPISKKWIYVALFLSLLLSLISSRKGFIIIVVFAPIIALLFNRFQRKGRINLIKYLPGVTIGLIMVLPLFYFMMVNLFNYDFSVQINDFKEGFNFSNYSDESSYVRRQQFFALLRGWEENIFLGQGHGAVADIIRSDEQPWAYELAYVALLFHAGLLGVGVYILAFGWIIWQTVRVARSGSPLGYYLIPMLTGTICFMIANATNPYLEKFDYEWIVFFPISVINYWLREKEALAHQNKTLE